jgi:hypothetical protein
MKLLGIPPFATDVAARQAKFAALHPLSKTEQLHNEHVLNMIILIGGPIVLIGLLIYIIILIRNLPPGHPPSRGEIMRFLNKNE